MSKFISVFVPTFNGEKYIGECLDAVLRQDLPPGYELEVLVTDSGSSDRTLEVLERFKHQIKLNQIPNKEFSHGRTRAKAAEAARGEFILFLTQDATPAHERWLVSMVEPFFIGEKVGCVFGAQVPRADATPTIKREVTLAFNALGERNSIMIHRHNSLADGKPTNGANTFFSDANSAVRRELLLGPVPFRDVDYAEDQALAEDMMAKGYLKAYAPQGEVRHSNEYTANEYFKRKFDEFTGLQESLGRALPRSLKSLLVGWIRPTWYDYKFIMVDRDYSLGRKLRGLVDAPMYNIASQAGRYYSSKHLGDSAARSRMSLEEKMRR
jgi:rhamnosyltransferase